MSHELIESPSELFPLLSVPKGTNKRPEALDCPVEFSVRLNILLDSAYRVIDCPRVDLCVPLEELCNNGDRIRIIVPSAKLCNRVLQAGKKCFLLLSGQ